MFPTSVVTALELEKNYLHSINDGFASGNKNAIPIYNRYRYTTSGEPDIDR